MSKVEVKPHKKPAPVVVPYLVALSYVVLFVVMIIGVCNMTNTDMVKSCIAIEIGIGGIDIVISQCFAWHMGYSMESEGSYINVVMPDIVKDMGKSETKIKIKDITGFKEKGRDLIVFGDITVRQYMSKPKNLRKYRFPDANVDEVKNLLGGNFNG